MLVVGSFLFMAFECQPEAKKCVILHNGHEITISVNALDAHMDHHDDCFIRYIYE
ncbi:hypothetical protein [Lutibacter sp.]|uniref:hypothetical protein n=1 Tax=Lutibacter sp. TaxID=1925666 RepID=UPI0035660AC9